MMSNDEFIKEYPNTVRIVSPKGKVYNIVGFGYPLCDPFCDCRGFSFRGDCSHIEKVREKYDSRRDL
jgi:hypothetical protein